MDSKVINIVIPGHGGMKNGVYTTAPAKMFKFEDGTTIYEGVENRRIVDKAILIGNSIPELTIVNAVPENEDISLNERIKRVNKIHADAVKQGKRALLWEIHNNASNGQGHGYEAWSTVKKNFSDTMKAIWLKNMKATSPSQRNRGAKEKNYSIINNVNCFGILLEYFFFDNKEDVFFNTTPQGVNRNAVALVESMLEAQAAYKF